MAIGFGSFAPFVQTVNNVDYFTLKDHPDERFYEQFKEVFGNDEFFVIAFEKKAIFTPDTLGMIKAITQELENSDLVREVLSLANVDNIVGEEDYFTVTPFLKDIPESEAGLAELKQEALDNPLYVKNLISPDGKTAAIVVFPELHPQDETFRGRLLDQVEDFLLPYKKNGNRFYLAGWTVTQERLGQYSEDDLSIFIPLTYILITLIVWLIFRSLRLTFAAILTICACLVSELGLFALTGTTMNSVTTIVPPLVMALAVTDIVHIFSHLDASLLENQPNKFEALAQVLNTVAFPCLMTSVTTAIGFLSLCVNELQPIREFALMASAGMLLEFFFAFFFLPPILLFFDHKKIYSDLSHKRRKLKGILGYANKLTAKRAKGVFSVFLLLTAGSIALIPSVKVDTNLLHYFKQKSPERSALEFVESRLSGVATLDISIMGQERDTFKEPKNLQALEEIQEYLLGFSQVEVVNSFVDFIKEMHESFHNEDARYFAIPDSKQLISQYLLLYDSDDINDYIDSRYQHARIVARVSEHSSSWQQAFVNDVTSHINKMDYRGFNIQITGRIVHDINVIHSLVSGQLISLALAGVVISATMFFVLQSMKIGFLSLLPNTFPIVLNFGIMALFGIPLNTATALISAIALGIAVDDTIHFLTHYLQRRRLGDLPTIAVQDTLLSKGRAIISSSLILSAGFAVLIFSHFVPTIQFGILTAGIMLTAMIGDIVFLPAAIRLWTPPMPEEQA